MNTPKKFVFIGAGAANMYAALYLVEREANVSITLIDIGKSSFDRDDSDILHGVFGAGFISDSKNIFSVQDDLNIIKYLGKEKVEEYYSFIQKQIIRFHPQPETISITLPTTFSSEAIKGWGATAIAQAVTWHVGSTWGIEVGKNIEHYLRSKGVNFILETTATDVDIKAKEVITTNNRVNYDKLFIATGRANSKFVNGILKKYNIDLKKSYLDIGCRFEIEYSDKVKQLSSLQYDFKLKDTVVTDNVSKDCRTFCVCHYSSYVAEEEKDGQFLGYNGHAYGLQAHDKKNNLTNFGILINLQNIDADEIMKVARNNKCQVLGSNISFTPSLPDYNIISHNEFKTLPAGIEILEFIKKLDNILAFGNNYKIYYPEIKEGSGKLEAPNKWQAPGLDDLYFVGDSAFCMHDGSTRGIVPAGVSGISAIDIALNKLSPL
jgi:uncharacterized FAD-dependent dehydrogenase